MNTDKYTSPQLSRTTAMKTWFWNNCRIENDKLVNLQHYHHSLWDSLFTGKVNCGLTILYRHLYKLMENLLHYPDKNSQHKQTKIHFKKIKRNKSQHLKLLSDCRSICFASFRNFDSSLFQEIFFNLVG